MSTETHIPLEGEWTIRQMGGELTLMGTVPGLVHHDLIREGLVPDPYFRKNELDQQWVGDSAWEYSRTFGITSAQAACRTLILDCQGLDTLADVYINGTLAGSADNMYRSYRWNIKPLVQEGSNEIRILFHPARPEMSRRAEAYHVAIRSTSQETWYPADKNFLRKSPTHGGWDWGPCFLTQGIYRDIAIECRNGPKILYLTHTQEHGDGWVDVQLRLIVDATSPGIAQLHFTLGDVEAKSEVSLTAGENQLRQTIRLTRPALWWPNGYGKAELTVLKAEISGGGEHDVVTQRIGLREIRVVREPDDAGESFYFQVNGVAVFAKGANWIPSDSFDSRLTDEQLQWELGSAAAANHNMVRVWGGGLYERDAFYRICDSLGLMVWQDFMFACALYPVNPEFLESVSSEVRHQVRRLAHHPSIALWCGNNENEQCFDWGLMTPKNERLYAAEYDHLYIQTILPIVAEEDPGRLFWPSSPSNGVRKYGDPNEYGRGDAHYWKVWFSDVSFDEYLKVNPRFSSEFGFQSFASPETMEAVTLPEDRNVTSPVFEFHQRSAPGNQNILRHIARQFRLPVGYENMLYVSQALQALSIKTACEHWRRIKPFNMGTLYWQLNDIWPGASWSSLECDGRWKMLHYFSRKFYAPLLVSAVPEEGELAIWITSDLDEKLSGTLQVELLDLESGIILSRQKKVESAAQGSAKALSFPLSELAPDAECGARRVLSMSLVCGDHSSTNEHFFAPFKALSLRNPQIESKVLAQDADRLVVKLRSDTLSPFVWLSLGAGIHGAWNDNGMHLMPGREVTVEFRARRPEGLKEFAGKVLIRTLYEAGF